MVLQPQASFSIIRQIANHLDTDTNFVRAVIRNASTDVIIATLNLTDQGGQRFTKNWQVPGDPSGQGFYISIVTSVYTSSAYTTKNPNYGDEETTYLVQERVLPSVRGAGGGANGVDAFTLRRIVKEEIGKIPAPEAIKVPPVRFDAVLSSLGSLEKKLVKGFASVPKTDLAPVIAGLKEIVKEIQQKEITPATDTTKLEQGLKDLAMRINQLTILTQTAEEKRFGDMLKSMTFGLTPTKEPPTMTPSPLPAQKPVPFDISKLAL